MKPSDIFNKIGGFARIASDIHSLTSLVAAFAGKDLPDDAPPLAKGLHGIFGRGDEREFQNLLAQLPPKDQELITRFFSWYFTNDDFLSWMVCWWISNDLRSFISGLGRSEGVEYGTRNRVVTTHLGRTRAQQQGERRQRTQRDRMTARTTTRTNLRTTGSDNRLAFLKQMVNIISEGIAEVPNGEGNEFDGFIKLREHLKVHGITPVPEDVAQHVRTIFSTVSNVTSQFPGKAQGVLDPTETHLNNQVAWRRKRDSPTGWAWIWPGTWLNAFLYRLATWNF